MKQVIIANQLIANKETNNVCVCEEGGKEYHDRRSNKCKLSRKSCKECKGSSWFYNFKGTIKVGATFPMC